MDVYTARSQLEKILKYIEDLTAAQPRMYAKSKDRWKDIADLSGKIIHAISVLIQEEMIDSDSSTFETAGIDVNKFIDSIEREIAALRQFSGGTGTVASDSIKLTTADCKTILRVYRDAVLKAKASTSEYPMLHEWVTIIADWIQVRFYECGHLPGFSYNAANFSKWLLGFVLAFGYSVWMGTYPSMLHSVAQWLDEVRDHSNNYPVPKCVSDFVDTEIKQFYTLESAVAWDVLYDAGLDMISINLSELNKRCRVEDDSIYNRCNQYNPDCLNRYTSFKTHPEILNLFRKEGYR